MALLEPSVLANTIMGKLYNVLTNGDDTAPKSDDNFFSWCTPGIPVEPSDLEYLTQGLTGVVKKVGGRCAAAERCRRGRRGGRHAACAAGPRRR